MSEFELPRSSYEGAAVRDVSHDDELNIYQASLSVQLIATDRSTFATCSPDELLVDVLARIGEFDFVPVVNGSAIVGVLPAHELRLREHNGGAVKKYMNYLDEKYLIGADASILEFIRDADSHPFRFLVKGRKVSGLVSLSDLQNLPVRAALFAMITQLEMALANLIKRTYPGDEWIDLLAETRQEKLRDEMEKARSDRNQVEPMRYAQLPDKNHIAVSILVRQGKVKNKLERELRRVDRLRNQLAHANIFAASRKDARQVCEVVRSIDSWISALDQNASLKSLQPEL